MVTLSIIDGALFVVIILAAIFARWYFHHRENNQKVVLLYKILIILSYIPATIWFIVLTINPFTASSADKFLMWMLGILLVAQMLAYTFVTQLCLFFAIPNREILLQKNPEINQSLVNWRKYLLIGLFVFPLVLGITYLLFFFTME